MAKQRFDVIISCNADQAEAVAKALETEYQKLRAEYQKLADAGEEGTAKAKEMAVAMTSLKNVIKENHDNMNRINRILGDLSNSSMRQLQRALRDINKEMAKQSENSSRMKELQLDFNRVSNQIKILKGEFVNVQKSLGNLGQMSDKWLAKAAEQQENIVSQIKQGTQAYMEQQNVLSRLYQEQARRDKALVQSGDASAEQLRGAKTRLAAYRDRVGRGGVHPVQLISPADEGSAAVRSSDVKAVKDINELLRTIDVRLDSISDKGRKVARTTQEVLDDAQKIANRPGGFSPNEIKAAIDEVKNKLAELPMSDISRGKLEQSAKELENVMRSLNGEIVDIQNLLKPENLRSATFEELSKGARQLEAEMRNLNQGTQEYISKQNALSRIYKEQLNRDEDNIINNDNASAEQLRAARTRLTAYRDKIGTGGLHAKHISSFVDEDSRDITDADARQLEHVNGLLSDIEDKLNAIAGKEVEVSKSTSEILQKAQSDVRNYGTRSLDELKNSLADVKNRMNSLTLDDPDHDVLGKAANDLERAIRIVNGELIDTQKLLDPQNLNAASLDMLTQASKQLEGELRALQRGTQEYVNKQNELSQVMARQMDIDTATIQGGNASAEQLRAAKARLASYRDKIGAGGTHTEQLLSAADESSDRVLDSDAQTLNFINQLLAQADARLDSISGKGKNIGRDVQDILHDLELMNQAPQVFSPNEIKAAIDEVKKKLAELPMSDISRGKLEQSAKELERQFKEITGDIVDIKELLEPQNLKKASLEQLERAAKQLDAEMKQLERDTAAYTQKKEQLAQVRQEIDRGTNAVKNQTSMLKRHIENLVSYMGIYTAMDFVKDKIMGVFELNLKLSDQLQDIRKVSGLAVQDIEKLSNKLASIDTRTTIEELNSIAYEGAKLGIPDKYGMEGLAQFTQAANQVNVALREELGQDALTELSKMVDVMGLIPKLGVEQSMLKTASAMFQLASSSTSSANNIVEFSKRLTGVARTAGITTDQLLALASAADSMALTPEVASTAFSQFITQMQVRHNLIENALSIPAGTINQLFSAGRMMDAIVLVLQKMQEKGNANALQNVFKSIGGQGTKIINVLTTMSQNVGMLQEQLEVGKRAFEEGTAVTREYELQQQTAQAMMERANNLWEKAFVNPEGVNMVKEMAALWYSISKDLTKGSVQVNVLSASFHYLAYAIRGVIALLPSLLTGLMLYGVLGSINAVYGAFQKAGGAVSMFTTLIGKMNWAMKLSVFGAVATAVIQLVMYFKELNDEARNATKYMDGFSSSLKDVNAQIASAQYEASRYKKAIDDAARGTNERRVAIENFQKKFGQYYKEMLTEASTANQIAQAYQKVCAALRAKMALENKQKDVSRYVTPAAGWYDSRLYEYGESVTGTNLSQYNSNWLDAFIRDQAKNGKQARGTYEALLKKWGVKSNNRSDNYINTIWQKYRSPSADADKEVQQWTKISNNPDNSGSKNVYEERVALIRAAQAISQFWSLRKRQNIVDKKYAPEEKNMSEYLSELDNDFVASPGALSNEAPDKSAQAEILKEQRDRLKEAQDQGRAIIDNVKNYYERQLKKITETANEQNWDKALVDTATDYIQSRMNTALAQVRFALKGTKNEWKKFKQTMNQDMIERADETGYNRSEEILGKIMSTDVNKTRDVIVRLTQALGQPANAALDAIFKNGTLSEKANAALASHQRTARNKRLFERDYTGKTDDEYRNSMETLGFYGLTDSQTRNAISAQVVHGMSPNDKDYAIVAAQASQWQQEAEQRNAAIDTAFQRVREHITELYALEDVASGEGRKRLLDILFGEDWQSSAQDLLPVLSMTGNDIKVFYDELLKYYDDYTLAEKKRDDERKKVIDKRWEDSSLYNELNGRQQQLDMAKSGVSQYSVQAQQRESEGGTVRRYDTYGTDAFMSSFGVDPEVESYRLKMAAAQAYYDFLKANGATAAQLAEQERSVLAAESEYTKAMVSQTKQRMDDLYALMSPIEDFGTAIGNAFATMTEDAEAGRKALKAAVGDMINSMLKQTLTMSQEYIKRRIFQKTNDYITSRQMQQAAAEQIQIEEDKQTGLRRAVRVGNDGKKQILTNWSKDSLGVIESEAQKEIDLENDKQSAVNKKAEKGGKKKQNIFQKIGNAIFGLGKNQEKKEVKQEEQKQDAMSQVQESSGEARQTIARVTEEGIGDIQATVGQETLQTQASQAQTSVQTESAETQAKIPMGIAEGASKIIGSLGWWGIPLVAVITALLNGLLSFAMSKVSSLFGGGDSSSDTGTTTKLVSGMLTYDKGNVQAFQGVETGNTYPVVADDGHVYAAKSADDLATGLVRDPITTLINGQPALVAERGPEMVIGRETTAAMMMSRPDLMAEIVRFDRTRSGMHYRAYDAGNVGDFAQSTGDSPLTPDDAVQLRATIDSLSTVLATIQQQGIQAHINQYGRGGVTEAAARGAQFMRKNSGDSLWKR